MDDFDKDQVLQWYTQLEEELLGVLKYIPPAKQNLAAFSPRLASVIIESCGLLDSILRQVSPDPAVLDGRSKPKKDLDIVDYAKLYAAKLRIPVAKSIVMITPPRYLSPFNSWIDLLSGGNYRPTTWWRTHTELKHDRIANLERAQLEVAIESLCGLHLMIATLPEFARAVLGRGWVLGKKMSPEYTIEILEGSGSESLLVESKLFAVARGPEKLPDQISDFHPSLFNASERVIDFFGRSY
jgi:hypothetical protein